MMEASLVLSIRQLQYGQNHLFFDFKISGFKNLEREELIFGDDRIVSTSNFSCLAEKQKHWLQEILILMVLEINPLAATEVPLSSLMTNCSTSAASFWEFKLNGTWRDSEILRETVHEKFNGSTGLIEWDFNSCWELLILEVETNIMTLMVL